MLNDVFIKVVGHSIVLIGRGLGTSKGRKLNKEAIVPISLSDPRLFVCLSITQKLKVTNAQWAGDFGERGQTNRAKSNLERAIISISKGAPCVRRRKLHADCRRGQITNTAQVSSLKMQSPSSSSSQMLFSSFVVGALCVEIHICPCMSASLTP